MGCADISGFRQAKVKKKFRIIKFNNKCYTYRGYTYLRCYTYLRAAEHDDGVKI